MDIIDKIREITEKEAADFRQDDNFIKMEKFYRNALESGMIRKPEYNLPQIDTIGVIFQMNATQK